MKTRIILTILCLAGLVAPAAAAAPLADRLPGGTLVYVGWAGRSLAFDGSMLGQLLKEPAVDSILGAIKNAILEQAPKEGPQAAAFEKAWAAAATAWQHPIAVALLDITPGEHEPVPSAAILIDLGKDRQSFEQNLSALLGALGKGLPLTDATAGSVTYKVLKGDGGMEVCFGYMGDVFFACIGSNAAKQLIELTPAGSLKANRKFADCAKSVGGDNEQLACYVDVTGLTDKLLKLVGGPGTRTGDKTAEVRKIIDALGVGKVTAIAGSMQIVERGMYSKVRIFSKAPHQGLLMPLAGGALSDADLAGVPEDADFVAACKLSPQALYDEIRRVIKEIEPRADERLGAELAQMEKVMGLSVTQDLLPGLGDTWVLSCAPSQGGFITGILLSVQVKDTGKFSAALGKIEEFLRKQLERPARATGDAPMRRMRRAPPTFETVKAGGTEIHYLAFTDVPVAPAWAIHKDRLYVALWPQVVQSAIEGGAERPITQDAAFRAARARITGKPSMLTYLNTPKVLRQAYNLLLVGWTAGSGQLAGRERFAAKPDWLPPLSKIEKYLWPEIGAVSADAEGITFEGYGSMPCCGLVLGPVGAAAAILVPVIRPTRDEPVPAEMLLPRRLPSPGPLPEPSER